jgi:lysophospholipase L1-like esterase
MKSPCFAAVVVAAVFALAGVGQLRADAPLANQRVLWLGDSITHQGAYITFVEFFLETTFPTQKFDIIEIGRPSETTSGLSEKTHPGPRPCIFDRLTRALNLIKPQTVVACYGMNDGIYHPQSPERMRAFEKGIHKLVDACHAAGATRVILLTPPPFDKLPVTSLQKIDAPDFSFRIPYEGYDSVLSDYAAWEKKLPPAEARVVDIHTPMRAYLHQQRQTNPQFSFVKDGIHPNPLGNLLMAEIILQGLGVTLNGIPDDLNLELADLQVNPTCQLLAKQHQIRSDAWFNEVAATSVTPALASAVSNAEKQCADLQVRIDKLRAPSAP